MVCFSTDQAEFYTSEAKANNRRIDCTVGILPPPCTFSGLASDLQKMSEAGQVLDRGGYTRAGRALAKHGEREITVFPKGMGTPAQINEQGQNILHEILTDSQAAIYPNRFGGVDIFARSGRGARYDEKGFLMGFLQPRHTK